MLAGAAVRNAVTAVVICMSTLAQADRAKAQIKALAVLNVFAFSINGALVCRSRATSSVATAQVQSAQAARQADHKAPEGTFLHRGREGRPNGAGLVRTF